MFIRTRPLSSTPYAITTFLTGQGTDDAYFNATRLLTYQFLHAPDTKIDTKTCTFLVVCSSTVPVSHKQRLQKDGATIVEVDDVPVKWWIRTSVRRWKEQFTKLRIFEMTEFQRILFLDADNLILAPLDPIFQEEEVKTLSPTFSWPPEVKVKSDEAALPSEWLFAARSDNGYTGARDHPIPNLQSLYFGAGLWIAAPSKKIYTHLLSVMQHWRRFDPYTMEQSLLNYVFRRNGPMPWRELNWKWSTTWPSERDRKAGVVTLHEKWWSTGPQELRDLWDSRMGEMVKFFGEKDMAS
ncbi:glycosyltransferase family 8 protein [Rhizodiscina lignyota]|uniref:Glycosyltransferase family 8 protein n=1 Tax=Rhizodiscina lignyota TaxID=1504668 RepID=A0A9P4M1J5_9PEZI|nr:glycosyltransferase family 8 protein [Rhizodiscina lignyota]